jgi:branched-chain amino acid aminotransferase
MVDVMTAPTASSSTAAASAADPMAPPEAPEASSAAAATRSAQGGDGRQLAIGAWAYFEGRLVPFADANVSIATHALDYGTAIFEGIRVYRQDDDSLAILFALEHFQRLLRNGRLLRARVSETPEDLVGITREMLRRNGEVADLYVRPLLYKSAKTIRLQLSGLEDRISIFSFPLGDYVSTEGLRVGLSAWQRVNDNAVPARGKIAGSYVNACLAVEDAKSGGYSEAIMLNADGHVSEASSANLFVVTAGQIATPPLSEDVLPGITRTAVIEIARNEGYAFAERVIDRTELYTADEVFLTGTGVQIAAIASIDDRPVGDGSSTPVVSHLQERYFAAVRGRDERYRHWLTKV